MMKLNYDGPIKVRFKNSYSIVIGHWTDFEIINDEFILIKNGEIPVVMFAANEVLYMKPISENKEEDDD